MSNDLLSSLKHTKHLPTSGHLCEPAPLLGITVTFHVGEPSHLSFQLRQSPFRRGLSQQSGLYFPPLIIMAATHLVCYYLSTHLNL